MKATSYDFESTSYEFEFTSNEFESMSYEFKSTSYEFKSTSYEFKFTSYELKSTSYEFESTSYVFESTSSGIIKSMKTQVNSYKSSSFPKNISPKLFGNSWSDLYVQFLVIIFCLTFPQLHGYGQVSKLERRDLNSPKESHPPTLPLSLR